MKEITVHVILVSAVDENCWLLFARGCWQNPDRIGSDRIGPDRIGSTKLGPDQ